jgi:trans-aconitate methyltransferase
LANDSQFKFPSRVVATRGVSEYRATIARLVQPSDVVLELGCEWGATTVRLSERCSCVIGTDLSPVCIERARASHPDLRFEVLDAFDVRAASDLGVGFNKVYMDLSGLSGYRSLLDVIALVTMYSTVLRPDTIVIKSAALKHFASRCVAWRGV